MKAQPPKPRSKRGRLSAPSGVGIPAVDLTHNTHTASSLLTCLFPHPYPASTNSSLPTCLFRPSSPAPSALSATPQPACIRFGTQPDHQSLPPLTCPPNPSPAHFPVPPPPPADPLCSDNLTTNFLSSLSPPQPKRLCAPSPQRANTASPDLNVSHDPTFLARKLQCPCPCPRPVSTPIRTLLPRKCKFPLMSSPPLPHDLDDVRPATGYPGAQRHHRLGISSSRHPGAGLGVFALSTLQTRSGGWRRNILCRYTGKKITYQAATADSYSSDYLVGWEEHDEAIDGAFATPPALGHLINDDFSRDGGSVEAVRDPRHPHHTFLILVEDVPRGSELSYAYGGPYWEPRLCALPQTSRSLCILKYRSYFHPARLAALGLSPTGASPTPAIPLEVPPHQRPQSILHWLHYRPSLRGLAPSFLLHPPCSPPPLCMDVVDQETLPLETLPQLSRVPSLPPATHSPPSVASHPLDSEPMQPSPLPTLLFPVSRLTTIPFPPDHCMYSSRCSSPMDGCSHPPSPVAHSSMADPLTPTHLPATSPFAPTPMDVSSLPIFTGPTPPPDQFSPPHPPDSPARPPMLDISEAPQPLPPPLLLPSNLLLSPPNSPTLPSPTPMDLPDSPQSRPSNLLLPLDRPPSPPQFPTRPSLTCPMDLPSLLSLDPSRITPSHSLPVPDHVFLRPLVVQHGNIRLWVHQASSACLLDMDADLPMGLTHWILSGHARLGCAMNLPTPLTAVCRPDGTCGHQFAAFAAICKGSFPSTLSSSWFFAAPPQRSLLLSTLGLWAHRPDLPVSTSQKVQAAVDWLSKGCPSLFPIADWLSFQDVSAILTPSIPCSFWGPVSRSPHWSSWHLYDGSSDHGLDIAARACTFASTLRPSRLNGSILHHHFVPWQTPPTLHQDFQCAVQVLSELLLTSFLHDPNDLGYTSSDTYRLIIAGHPSVLPQRASTFRPTPPATRLAPPTPPTTLDSPPRRTQPFPTCPLTPPLPGPPCVMDLRSPSPLRSPDTPLPTLLTLPNDLHLSLVHSRAPPAPSRSTPLDAADPLATCSPLSLPLSPSLTHLAVPMDTDPSPLPSWDTFLRPPPAVASLPKRRPHPSSKRHPPSVSLLSIKHFLRPALQTKELPLSPFLTMSRSHLLAHLASSPSPTIPAPSLTARGYTILPPPYLLWNPSSLPPSAAPRSLRPPPLTFGNSSLTMSQSTGNTVPSASTLRICLPTHPRCGKFTFQAPGI